MEVIKKITSENLEDTQDEDEQYVKKLENKVDVLKHEVEDLMNGESTMKVTYIPRKT